MIPGMPGESLVYLNGEFTRADQAKISVLDRGFIFGDGIYEVVPAYQGKPFRMAEHFQRLERSLAAIRIPMPMDRAALTAVIERLIAAAPSPDCLVYLQITRGVYKRDHAFPAQAITPTVFAMVTPLVPPSAKQRDQGVAVISIEDERWLHCEIKSVSLLGNVLARQQAVEAGVDEVIQYRDGFLTEGSASNIWIVRDGKLLAPPKNNLILEGIRYGLMAELAEAAGVSFEARRIARAEVESAEEVLVTSATKEVLAVTRIDGKPVGDGKPGPIYRQLRAGYDARIAAL
ncbi:D-amino acid aminotransferase [Bordetella holmesii]|uniref:D-amino acid aminotransferase n=1 Tax=Bordetella holmesii TaxID=35814 RepID=UPI0002BAEA0E|nr:D-amino acid aminotransferase [Bordetella holmesii]AHV94323.1 aminotransferase class IV family protein [Bordetella holmesii ATCC 51541]AMD49505.1 cytochrome C550 [Bordetella holmesii F627]AUL21091.1 D-amino acid aminotransferase [Bordetella holmesii]AUL24428.1 D-amino acid aminotransferase [Bordetella holmesii]AUL27757.1 D-amino acid aminotransferase [Bordetella holmesii]